MITVTGLKVVYTINIKFFYIDASTSNYISLALDKIVGFLYH